MHLNISKMLVMLNYVDYMKEPIQKIKNGEKEVNIKYHIGAGYHISMGNQIFPTQKGISLKFPEWIELMRVFDDIF